MAGQDRAVVGPLERDRDGLGVLHADDRGARAERLPALGRQDLAGVVGVQALDVEVLVVEIGRGRRPAEPVAAPGEDGGRAGDRGADHAARREVERGEVPDRGGREGEMRVARHQGAAGGGAGGRGGPGVRGAAEAPRGGGVERVAGGRRRGQARQVGEKRRIFGKVDHGRARRVGKDVADAVGRQHQRDPRAQHLVLQLVGQAQRHELADGDAVGRGPGGEFGPEQPEFGRAAAERLGVHDLEPGVHAAGIGLERGDGGFVLRRHRGHREAVEVEPPQELVDAQGAFAEDLRQPPLRGPAQHGHLPEPVLGMGEAQAEEHVGVARPRDVWHVGVVAHDLDPVRDPCAFPGGRIVGDRPREEPVDEHEKRRAEHDRADEQSQEPVEDRAHCCPC